MLYPVAMDFKEKLQKLHDFLAPYEPLWSREIMLEYPRALEGYPQEWLDELSSFTDPQTQIQIEKKKIQGLIKNEELLKLYKIEKELTTLPTIEIKELPPSDKYTYLFMIPKKQHEIMKFAPLINAEARNQKIKRIIDIGGGIGLLAQTLSNSYGLNVHSFDQNQEFQATGKERNQKNTKDPDHLVHYQNLKIGAQEKDFLNYIQAEDMTVGLHTCGPLAVHQIQASVEKKLRAIMNMGCCYHLLEDTPFLGISAFSKTIDFFKFNKFALTLACRAHKKLDQKDFDLKYKVKVFRYGIHLFLYDCYDQKELLTLGNSHPKLYDGSFSHYVREQFKRTNLELRHNDEEIDQYLSEPTRKKYIDDMITAGIIRNLFGRALEVYLLLDRAIFLEEQGYQASLVEIFDEELSPRNICLIGTN